MPVIRTTLLQGFSTPKQRSELATRLADTLADVYGEYTRPFIYSIVDEVMPGTWSMGGRLTDDEMIASGFVAGQEFRNKRVTKDRVEAAYGALANGDRTPIEE